MPKTRMASANWTQNLKQGNGHVSVDSGAIDDAPVTYRSRFEDAKGTNPEELVAAAHASCFSMALAAQMSDKGYEPQSIKTDARVHLESANGGFAITKIELDTKAKADGISNDEFQTLANQAKEGCPISKLVGPGLQEIALNAFLV